jgi:murein DD-endopeptidase MepM/ murein hydrolase activator NlpD
MTTSINKTADVFRAPIEGNPVEGRITLKNSNTVGPYLATANGFAVDGITRNLWLHVRSDDLLWRWVRVKAASGESYEIPIPGESLNAVVPVEGMAGIDPVELTEAEVSSCVSAASSDRTAQYPLANVPWTLPATPFDWMPLSTDSICQNSGGINQIWGFGLYDINRYALRLPKGYHPGVDFFGYIPATSATSVYSIGDMGIVVGIGINEDNVDSAANWGSSNLVENPGYSIIVRYGHLYVLYGHLREVDPSIYVGKQVSKAARLGAIGTYDAEGDLISEPHLHLEIRTFGEAVASGALVIQDGKTKGNIFGILKLGGTQAVPLYDIAQLFAPVAFAYVQDFGASDSTATVVPSIATVTSLGALLEGGSSVIFGPFCSIQYLLALTTPSSTQTMSPTPRINNFRINTVLRQTPASIRSLRNGENPSVGIDPAITPDPQSYQ